MDIDTNTQDENRPTPHQYNKNNSDELKGINNKPKQNRARTQTATRANRKHLEEIFPAKYIESGLNGTKAYQSIRPHSPNNSARVEASRILAKPNVKDALHALMADSGLSLKETMAVHKRNLIQDEDLRVSQTAVQDVYKISGLMNNRDTQPTVNIALFIKE